MYDVIVIGAGHAGCEAALATARLGLKTLIFTINLDTIAFMSCNPAIGGLAKGHLVREIDTVGGEMAKAIDETGIQFRRLNTKKGPAVHSSRAQADKYMYKMRMKRVLESTENLEVKQAVVEEILEEKGRVIGIETGYGERYFSKAVIVTTGTFLNGLIHIGLKRFPAGRAGESPSIKLSESLRRLGFEMGRLKTGTTPRLDGRTIDYSGLEKQYGDDPPKPFSYSTEKIIQKQVPCYITYTNPRTHEIIKGALDRSPLYSGVIKGIGPRYCPSIEDKVMRFSDKDRHQVFLEPEGRETVEVYPNGVSTSLPLDIQIKFLRTIEGLKNVEIMRPGYAIEYDFIFPTQLEPTLETRSIKGLYLAGQINGTSGYEEAAAQGLIAGINAALKIMGKEHFILDRSEAYIGVLIDDLVTKGTREPYRMFTSRAEYRLLLREGNADLRLMEKGYRINLIREDSYNKYLKKRDMIEKGIERLKQARLKPDRMTNERLISQGTSPIKTPTSLEELLRRPEIDYSKLRFFIGEDREISGEIAEEIEVQIKYEGYIERQLEQVRRFKKMEGLAIPEGIDFKEVYGLTAEAREKLEKTRPISIGQASRIAGMTPAAISAILIHMKKNGHI